MKILHIITSLHTGGAETLVVNMLPRFVALGHEVGLVVFNGERTALTDRLERECPECKLYALGTGYYNPTYILKLIKIMRQYDVIHTHNSSPQLFAAIANGFCHKKLVTTEHNTNNRKRGNWLLAKIDRWMYTRYDRIICISDKAEENLREYLNENGKANISHTENTENAEKKGHADLADNADFLDKHGSHTEITERYLTTDCTNNTDIFHAENAEKKGHADCADNADCCHTEITEITERYLTTDCTNNTDIFHTENAENAEKKRHADLADNADCCHTEITESTESTERYLTQDRTNNTDIFHAENAESAEKKSHADHADFADCCHTESTEITERYLTTDRTNNTDFYNDNEKVNENGNGKIITIYNGVEVEAIHQAETLDGERTSRFLVVMVAAFRPQKDQDTLIKAMSLLPKDRFELWLVGDGERRNCLEELVVRHNLTDNVRLLGLRTDVPRILKTADVVVMSTHYEGLSLSNIEGMSSGRPFVASDVDGIHEVTEGYGILVPHEDAEALAGVIKKLAEDKTYYDEVAERCYQRARQFDIEEMVAKYNAIYLSQK